MLLTLMLNLGMFNPYVPPTPPSPPIIDVGGQFVGGGGSEHHNRHYKSYEEQQEEKRIDKIKEENEFLLSFLKTATNIINNQ